MKVTDRLYLSLLEKYVLNNMPRKMFVAAFVGWVLLCFLALLYISKQGKSEFDPQQRLLNSARSPHFDEQFATLVNSVQAINQATIVHFQAPSCSCNLISQSHRQSVVELAAKNNYTNIELNVTENLREFVPSTPAVAILDEQGKLIYLGPYSSGFYCSANEGLVEPFILGTTTKMPNAVIISEARGCYCET
jgi:hypothetical protein